MNLRDYPPKIVVESSGVTYTYEGADIEALSVSRGTLDGTTVTLANLRGLQADNLLFYGIKALVKIYFGEVLVSQGDMSAPAVESSGGGSLSFDVVPVFSGRGIWCPRREGLFPMTAPCVFGGAVPPADGGPFELFFLRPEDWDKGGTPENPTVDVYFSPFWGPAAEARDSGEVIQTSGFNCDILTGATGATDLTGRISVLFPTYQANSDVIVVGLVSGNRAFYDNYENVVVERAFYGVNARDDMEVRQLSLPAAIEWIYRNSLGSLNWDLFQQYRAGYEWFKVFWYFVDGYPSAEEAIDELAKDLPLRRIVSPQGYYYRFVSPFPEDVKETFRVGEGAIERVSGFAYTSIDEVENKFEAGYARANEKMSLTYRVKGNPDADGFSGAMAASQQSYGERMGQVTYNTHDVRTAKEALIYRALEKSFPKVELEIEVPLAMGIFLDVLDTIRIIDSKVSFDRLCRIEEMTLSTTTIRMKVLAYND